MVSSACVGLDDLIAFCSCQYQQFSVLKNVLYLWSDSEINCHYNCKRTQNTQSSEMSLKNLHML